MLEGYLLMLGQVVFELLSTLWRRLHSQWFCANHASNRTVTAVNALNLKSAREQSDRKVIRHALARSEGNISSTAKMLGISRPTLYDLLKQYDLQA